jgi:hypothetical protein
MPQSQRLSSFNSPVAFRRPACPKCKAEMRLASIEQTCPGVDLHTFECAAFDHVVAALAAYERSYEVQGPWTLASRRFPPANVRRAPWDCPQGRKLNDRIDRTDRRLRHRGCGCAISKEEQIKCVTIVCTL